MIVVVVTEPGGPEKLALQEVPDPEPGRGELLVRVRATALNRAFLLQCRGLYPPPAGVPPYLGLEMAGEVLAAGAGVTGWQVLVQAGGSGVGTAAIRLARRAGARVLATARRPEKLAGCRELGANAVFDGREPGLAHRVRAATGGRGVGVILELVGATYWEDDLAMLAPGGRLVLVGLMGGSQVSVDLGRLLNGNLQILGSTLRHQSLAYKAALSCRFWDQYQGDQLGGLLPHGPGPDPARPFPYLAGPRRLAPSSELTGSA